jgi:CheY-like chemotaxis protein
MGRTLILAEDDVDDRFLFEQALREVAPDCELLTAGDGKELLTILSETDAPPEVIILDINMPFMDGFQVIDKMKSSPALRTIPVVVFSTTAQQSTVDSMYSKGASFYACKPYSFDELKEFISIVLAIQWKSQNGQPAKGDFMLYRGA